MRFTIALVVAAGLHAQPLPTGFLRGVLVGSQPGEFSVRAKSEIVYRFESDGKTWIEREHERISAAGLRRGEIVEVVSDRDFGKTMPVHYARMVQVVTEARQQPPLPSGMYRLYRPIEERRFIAGQVAGDVTYSGVVIEVTGQRIVLRTRLDGEKIVFLHPDTRCLEEGLDVEAAALRPYTHVFVEGEKDRNNQIDARRIVWGSILGTAGLRD